MPSEDLRYFWLRMGEERERASAATSAASREIHLEMARRYASLCRRAEKNEQLAASNEALRRSHELLKMTAKHIS